MTTQKETVKLLCKSIVTRLENDKAISFPARLRQVVAEEVYNLVGPYILTDEDVRDRALIKMGARAEMLQDANFSEGDQFRAAKTSVIATLGDDKLNGFYFQRTIKHIAETIAAYFMRSSNIDEVYETDEDLVRQIVDTIQKFKASNVH
jgi:hypothetical protein